MDVPVARSAVAPYEIRWILPFSGLLAALCVACYFCPVPPRQLVSAQDIFVICILYVPGVLLAAVVTIRAGFSLLPAGRQNMRHMVWRTLPVALWLPPTVLFVAEESTFALALLPILTVGLIYLFRFYSDGLRKRFSRSADRQAGAKQMFQLTAAPPLLQRKTLPIAAALMMQLAGLAVYLHAYSFAAMLLAVAIGLLSLFSIAHARRSRLSRHWLTRLPLKIVFAMLLTAIGLLPWWKIGPLYSSAAVANNWLNSLLASTGWRKTVAPQSSRSVPNADPGNGDYSGVILWPGKAPEAIMLVPPPANLVTISSPNLSSKPLTITFRGTYWFFKYPHHSPPEHSYRGRGTPATVGMHSADYFPLQMEAHQKFSSPVALSCCSQILVEITNQDHYARTVWLEVVLSDSGNPEPPLSLGLVPVKSNSGSGDSASASEVLAFNIPASAAISEFDELTVRFHLRGTRYRESARIAVERFTLVPRAH